MLISIFPCADNKNLITLRFQTNVLYDLSFSKKKKYIYIYVYLILDFCDNLISPTSNDHSIQLKHAFRKYNITRA